MPKTKHRPTSLIKNGLSTLISTWNVHGDSRSESKRQNIIKSFSSRKVQIAALQETRFIHEEDHPIFFDYQDEGRLIFLPIPPKTNSYRRYGLGFFVCPEWIPHIYGVKAINNRIAVIRFKLNKTKTKSTYLTLINVYAPTSSITREAPEATIEFYEQLQHTYDQYKSSSVVLLAGDFNAHLGDKQPGENFIGHFCKGLFRNTNGHHLASFLEMNDLLATNTLFSHPYRHMSTWSSKQYGRTRHSNGINRTIYTQVDFIITPQHLVKGRKILINARSHEDPTILITSDHKPVITYMNLKTLYTQPSAKRKANFRRSHQIQYNHKLLTGTDSEKYREAFGEKLIEELDRRMPNNHQPLMPHKQWSLLQKSLQIAAKSTLPLQPQPQCFEKVSYSDDRTNQLTARLKTLRSRLQSERNMNIERNLRKEIKITSNCLKERFKQLRLEKIEEICAYLELHKHNKQAFEALKILKWRDRNPTVLIDENNFNHSTPNYVIPTITSHFKDAFSTDNHNTRIHPWISRTPTPLQEPVTLKETSAAIARLNNNKSTGPDNIPAEILKYGGERIALLITEIINNMFATNHTINALLEGLLIAINKPKKPKTPTNLRPISLLNTIRKVLSNIVQSRISPKMEEFISPNQSGFRPGRSTADVTWAYRMAMACTQKYNISIRQTGLDLSKAFDCVDRKLLLTALKDVKDITTSELQMIQFLMSNTTLQVKVDGQIGERFHTRTGIPQGDGLSPILFAFYLEVVMRKFQEKREEYKSKDNSIEHIITHYADDTDFLDIDTSPNPTNTAQTIQSNLINSLSDCLHPFNLKFNNKLSFNIINKASINDLDIKKLGTILNPSLDIDKRVGLANKGFSTLWKLWLNDKQIPLLTKVRFYKACILPILTYNLHTAAYSLKDIRHLEAVHRNHLRRLCRNFYPAPRMRNSDLYITCACEPISINIFTLRWKLFGHILRLPSTVPANRYMIAYFSPNTTYQKYQGNQPINLPNQLKKDLKEYGPDNNNVPFKLTNLNDLNRLRTLAQDRDKWRTFVYHISTNYQQAVQQEIYDTEEDLTIPSLDSTTKPRSRRRRRRNHQHGEDTAGRF